MSKKLTLLALLALLMVLSGCSLFRSAVIDNDDQESFLKGTVIEELRFVDNEALMVIMDTKTGAHRTLVCPPHLIKKCSEYKKFSVISPTVTDLTHVIGSKFMIQRFSGDKVKK